MFGILNIDKPAGVTSRDVVNKVQRLVKPAKAGHAGTLDPLATGVLVVCLGKATRLIDRVQRQRKHYTGTFLLGRHSDTEDSTGNVVELENPPKPTRDDIEAVLPRFEGRIEQVPPAYSAKKVAGRRAYDLARAGKQFQLSPKTIDVHELNIRAYDYPEFVLDVVCGSGTYIRSLGRDIAHRLGTTAVMSGLERTAIGPFSIVNAVDVDELTRENIDDHAQPAILAVADLPTIEPTADEIAELFHGRRIRDRFRCQGEEVVAVDTAGQLVALLQPIAGSLKPTRCFPP
jgi:tRNA pseudouridine55 synthase